QPGLYCWGAYGALATRIQAPSINGAIAEVALEQGAWLRTDRGRIYRFDNNHFASKPFEFKQPDVTALSVEKNAGCARLRDGRVACWADLAEPGLIEDIEGARAVAVGFRGDGCAILAGGRVACFELKRDPEAHTHSFTPAGAVAALRGARSLALGSTGG